MAKVGVIYSRSQGRVRRWIVPDYDAELASIAVHPGEEMLIIERQDYGDLHQLQRLVNQATGREHASDRHHVINDAGDVVATIHADPSCGDHIPGHRLVPHG